MSVVALFWHGLPFVVLAAVGKLGLGLEHWPEVLATLLLVAGLRYLILRWLDPPEERPVVADVPAPVEEVPCSIRLGRISSGAMVGAALLLLLALSHPRLSGDWRIGLEAGLSVLVLASAPAYRLAAVATFGAVQRRARQRGIVLHNKTALEYLAHAKTMVFNKTGTLTRGTFRISEVASLDERYEPEEILRLAAALENRSDHRLAGSLVRVARKAHLALPRAVAVESLAGLGIQGEINGRTYHLGSSRLMRQLRCDLAPFEEDLRACQELGETVLFLSVDEEIIGLISAADPIRPEAAPTLQALKRLGFRSMVLLTGDDAGAARCVSQQLSLDQQHPNLRPADKISYIESMQARHQAVVMVAGDEDESHTLAQADVGILVGTRLPEADPISDIEVSSLSQLPEVVQLSRQWVHLMRRNLLLALGTTGTLLLLMFCFPPLPLYLGVLGQEGAALAVVFNAQRAKQEGAEDHSTSDT
jgi:Cd2+/Zn2+-exporting ATPase